MYTCHQVNSMQSALSPTQSSKPEINLMKLLGVVSPKAGRTLLYRVSDVAKMYPHWKMIIPDFVEELCAGKVGGG